MIAAGTPVRLGTAALAAPRARDVSRPRDIWAPDAVDHFLAVGEYRGRDAIARYFRDLFAAFPALIIDTEQIHKAGQDVAVAGDGHVHRQAASRCARDRRSA